MFLCFDKFLLNTTPPAESELFHVISQDDFSQPESKLIAEASNLLLSRTFPV